MPVYKWSPTFAVSKMEYVLNVITIEQFPAIGTITDYLVWGKFYNDMVRCVCFFYTHPVLVFLELLQVCGLIPSVLGNAWPIFLQILILLLFFSLFFRSPVTCILDLFHHISYVSLALSCS